MNAKDMLNRWRGAQPADMVVIDYTFYRAVVNVFVERRAGIGLDDIADCSIGDTFEWIGTNRTARASKASFLVSAREDADMVLSQDELFCALCD